MAESTKVLYVCDYAESGSSFEQRSPSTRVMLRPVVLGLVLACAVSFSSGAVILDNGAPIMWAHATAALADFPVTNGVLNPDPWHYLHRMSFYRVLIGSTDTYMGSMGTGSTENPLWGLPLQLGWMLTSGRMKMFLFILIAKMLSYFLKKNLVASKYA